MFQKIFESFFIAGLFYGGLYGFAIVSNNVLRPKKGKRR
jgi:hypothetical protein